MPYVVPFAAFLAALALGPKLGVTPRVESLLRVSTLLAIIALLAWPVLRATTVVRSLASAGVGIGVFVLWIAPDVLVPGYREAIIFQNDLTGTTASSLPEAARDDPVVLALRFVRATLIVPIVEELFWRGWLPRWLDRMDDFQGVPLGTFSRFSFVGTAVLFGLEHGAYWDVGFAAGIVYNWWMLRTRSLGDLILCHGVTNACLSAYVLMAGRWEYW